MSRTCRLMSALIVMALAGCQSVSVDSEYGPGMAYEGLGTTYGWMAPEAAPGDDWLRNESLNAAIRQHVDDGLRARGHRAVADNPDFNVTYRLSSGYEVDPWRQDIKGERGRLEIEIIDPKTRALFWRGTAQAPMKPDDPIEVRQKRLTDAVNSILAKLPSKAAGS